MANEEELGAAMHTTTGHVRNTGDTGNTGTAAAGDDAPALASVIIQWLLPPYLPRAVQSHMRGGQFDSVRLPHARPMGVHRTCGGFIVNLATTKSIKNPRLKDFAKVALDHIT